jgi:hypothetical protein
MVWLASQHLRQSLAYASFDAEYDCLLPSSSCLFHQLVHSPLNLPITARLHAIPDIFAIRYRPNKPKPLLSRAQEKGIRKFGLQARRQTPRQEHKLARGGPKSIQIWKLAAVFTRR